MKKKPRRQMQAVPEAPPRPDAGQWSCAQIGQRLVCHQVGGDQQPWWIPMAFGLVTFIVLGLPFLALSAFFFFAGTVKTWIVGGLPGFDDSLGLIGLIVAIVAIYSLIFSALAALMKSIYRFEIDVDRQEFVLHISSYPNRTRMVVVPFAEVISVNLCSQDAHGAKLQLYYQEGRRRRYGELGGELPDALLIGQLDRLKLVIGDKVTAPVKFDP